MKRLIILLSVIITILCGCGNTDENKISKSTEFEEKGEDFVSKEPVDTIEPTKDPEKNVSTEEPAQVPTEVPTEKPTEISTQKPTEVTTEKATEVTTEAPTQKPTEVTTQTPTEAPTQAPTESPTQAHTEKTTQAPIKAPVEMETLPPIEEQPTASPLPTYDIYSEEYARQVKEYTLQYINEYRASDGNVPLTNSPFVAEYSQGRSTQLVTNFAHDTDDERAMATKLKYGRYIDPSLYGLEGEPYYSPTGGEAICKMSITKYVSPEAMGRKIAKSLYKSKGHWNYVGGTMDVYKGCVYSGIGATCEGNYMYICVTVDDIKWE